MANMNVTLAAITVLCMIKCYDATVEELSEADQEKLLAGANERRQIGDSSDMKKMCWTGALAADVRQAATDCDAVMQYATTSYKTRVQITKGASDELEDMWYKLYDLESVKNQQLSDCEYTDECGAAKIMKTASVSGIYCVKTTCSSDLFLYCGYVLASELKTSMPAFKLGRPCEACEENKVCEDELCTSQACMKPTTTTTTTATTTTTTTTTATTTTMMPVMEENIIMNGTMPTHGDNGTIPTQYDSDHDHSPKLYHSQDNSKDPNHVFLVQAFYSTASATQISYMLEFFASIVLYAYQ